METNIKLQILNSFGKIFEQAKDSKLAATCFKKIDKELNIVAQYFDCSKSQAFFIAIIFTLNYEGSSVDFNDLLKHFNCNAAKLLLYTDDFNYLCDKGVFTKHQSRHRIMLEVANDQFTINQIVAKAILQNQPLPKLQKEGFKDVVEVLEKLHQLGQDRKDDKISTTALFNKSKKIIADNLNFELLKKVTALNFEMADTYILLYSIWKTISGNTDYEISVMVEGVFDSSSERVNYMQAILLEQNVLIKNDFLEIVPAKFFTDTSLKLTSKSLQLLSSSGLKFYSSKKQQHIISPQQIKSKQLYYNDGEMVQLELLQNLLIDKNLKATQKKLVNKSLPKGITILLHGSSGTGKTESVLQMAKSTKREIMKVDISQSKSKWFGESEKIIQRIFTDYTEYTKECKRIPILLFNEADGIFSKRKSFKNSNSAQTENTIQNILLEALENFEGILMATTNLANNLDAAFERRFLFKVEFKKPTITNKAKIWNYKLPKLSDADCYKLAEHFDFSGGQIDNVVRKNEIQSILNGKEGNLDTIYQFCEEETLTNTRNLIGFNVN